MFENLPKIKYFLAYVNRSIGPTIKIILSVQDNFCRTFATVRRTFGMTGIIQIQKFITVTGSPSFLCRPTAFFSDLLELSDVPRLQQVEKKAVGRQKNLGLCNWMSGNLVRFLKEISCLYLQPFLVTSTIKGILAIVNLNPGAFRCIFWHGHIVLSEVQASFQFHISIIMKSLSSMHFQCQQFFKVRSL